MIEDKNITDIDIARKLIQIQDSARCINIEFNMSIKKIKRLLLTKKCYFSGRVLNRIANDDNQLTFDRIDNNKGYTDDNVVACSWKINKLKANLTVADISMLYKAVNKKLTKKKR